MAHTRGYHRLSPKQLDRFRDGLACLATQFAHAAILDSCGLEAAIFPTGNEPFSLIAGFATGETANFRFYSPAETAIHRNEWFFGHLCYELKDKFEPGLHSGHDPHNTFKDELFFPADLVFLLRGEELEVLTFNGSLPEIVLENLLEKTTHPFSGDFSIVAEFPQTDYLENFSRIQKHLLRGDIYELNYCIPYTCCAKNFSPSSCWRRLNQLNPAPFSALYRQQDNWLISASPERFLKKSGNRLFSQPIKGTARRGKSIEEDEDLKQSLNSNEKEKAENIMITDLVRNDLSRISKKGTVNVDELCGLYSFRHVHQLITTVSAELKDNTSMQEILKATFPMGSMTGAPKYRAMQIIEERESFRRGLFSGSVGYISPEGDFDLNVVIRSILYNAKNGQLLIPAGSAITAKSEAMTEYEECRLKAAALLSMLQNTVNA